MSKVEMGSFLAVGGRNQAQRQVLSWPSEPLVDRGSKGSGVPEGERLGGGEDEIRTSYSYSQVRLGPHLEASFETPYPAGVNSPAVSPSAQQLGVLRSAFPMTSASLLTGTCQPGSAKRNHSPT